MVVVMPGLSERWQREPEDVGGPILGLEAARPEEVAHGVDAPGDVVEEKNPDEAAPQKPEEPTSERARDREPRRERDREAEGDDEREGRADRAHHGVLDKVARVAASVGVLRTAQE